MSFSREDCDYTNFNIENHKIEFSVDEDGILISIPFADDTPQCIKDRLNDIIFQEMNKYQEAVECMSKPCCLRLNASMQVQCYNDGELEPQYYTSMVITDIPEIESGTWIDKTVNILSEASKRRNEFISYCQYQVNKLLFPFGVCDMEKQNNTLIDGFWDRLDEEIRRQNKSKLEIAKKCRFDRKTLYRPKQDNRYIRAVYFARLCVELKVSADYLLFGEEGRSV